MSDLPVIDVDGRPVLALPPTGNARPSSLVFALHKGGSSLLNRMVRWMCKVADQPFVPVMQSFFAAGVSKAQIPAATSAIFRPAGYCYGTFRAYPSAFAIPILATAPQVLLVRDPRDMLTSLYFSVHKSTAGPADLLASRAAAARLDIDELVLATAQKYLNDFAAYERHLVPDRLLVLRYEDVIYDKAALARRVAAHIGLPVPAESILEIAAAVDQVPDGERPERHVRQVHPGDHARKLRPGTVALLNEHLAPVLDRYGYERR